MGCLFAFFYSSCLSDGAVTAEEAELQSMLQAQKTTRQVRSRVCIDSARSLLKNGDIITRTGNDFTSQGLRQFCRQDNTYSHCGIVDITDGQIYVYHALGGEINPDQKLKKESLAGFCDALDNLGFGVFRFPLTPLQQTTLHRLLLQHYTSGLPFDMDFDLASDSAMYCSEFVYKMLEQASGKQYLFRQDTVNGMAYMAPDRIFLHKDCKEIRRYLY